MYHVARGLLLGSVTCALLPPQHLQYQSYEPGQAIYRAAEAPNRFFVVLSGTVDLYQPKHETPEEIARAK